MGLHQGLQIFCLLLHLLDLIAEFLAGIHVALDKHHLGHASGPGITQHVSHQERQDGAQDQDHHQGQIIRKSHG